MRLSKGYSILVLKVLCSLTLCLPFDGVGSLQLNSSELDAGVVNLNATAPFAFDINNKRFAGNIDTSVHFDPGSAVQNVRETIERFLEYCKDFYPPQLDGMSLANGAEIVHYAGNIRLRGRWSARNQNLNFASFDADLMTLSDHIAADQALLQHMNSPFRVLIVERSTGAAFYFEAAKITAQRLSTGFNNWRLEGFNYPEDVLNANDARAVVDQALAWARSFSTDARLQDSSDMIFVSGKISLNLAGAVRPVTTPAQPALTYRDLIVMLNLVRSNYEYDCSGIWTGFSVLFVTITQARPENTYAYLELSQGVRVSGSAQLNGMRSTWVNETDNTPIINAKTNHTDSPDVSAARLPPISQAIS